MENQFQNDTERIQELKTCLEVGGETYEGKGGRARLIVTHYCGDSKEDLIGQLETMIYGLKTDLTISLINITANYLYE